MSRFRLRRGDVEVEFEGEAKEVAQRFDEMFTWMQGSTPKRPEVEGTEKKPKFKKTGESKAIEERIGTLKGEGYFETPRELGDVRTEMKTRGWYHDSPAVQAVLLRRGRELGIKRLSEGGSYKYVRV
jgi:hypothetical protein